MAQLGELEGKSYSCVCDAVGESLEEKTVYWSSLIRVIKERENKENRDVESGNSRKK